MYANNSIYANNSLKPDFYNRPVTAVSRDLLGMVLYRITGTGVTSGRIVEVEAYDSRDPAAHSFAGETARNKPMFGPPGRAYIYFIYGNHYCFNVVTGPEGEGAAVLVRALEPLAGLDIMYKRRAREPLTSGPGRLCQALAIDTSLNDYPLWEPPLWLEKGYLLPWEHIAASPRIGISKNKDLELRFYLEGNKFVSRK